MTEDLSDRDPTEIDLAIARWFDAYIANSPVSRSVEALNHLRSALVALEAEIIQTLTPASHDGDLIP